MRFSVPWTINPEFGADPMPLIDLFLQTPEGEFERFTFLIDSGAEASMAPASVAGEMGLDLRSGTPVELKGISRREECSVAGHILPVEIHILEAQSRGIPVCFAEGEAPYLVGRRAFFDAFRIQLDQSALQTHFETVES